MKRIVLILSAVVLATSSCSAPNGDRGSDDVRTMDVTESADSLSSESNRAPPGIVPTAAPGVAFAYNYGFRLPDPAISAAQEAHAAACEKLGLARCRITGMTYELDERDRVEGSLEIAVDPLIARAFGRDAIAVIEKNEGKLRYARITGEDQNPTLDDAARREGSANRSITQLEADLARAKTENERVQLREQIRRLREEIQASQSTTADSEAKIRRTPMTFTYRGGAASRGFAGENPVTEAWYLFVDSVAALVSVVLKIVAVVVPWLALLILLVLVWQSRLGAPLRRFWKKPVDQSRDE